MMDYDAARERMRVYADEKTDEGRLIIEMLSKTKRKFSVIPMSGVPEVTVGFARYVGTTEIRTLVERLTTAPELNGYDADSDEEVSDEYDD